MDRADFDSRYRDLVVGQIENFGKKEAALPDVGRIGCSRVIVELPLESVAALQVIAKREGSSIETIAPIRIAGGLQKDDVLRSGLNTFGAEELHD